jgi:hypothetical protein
MKSEKSLNERANGRFVGPGEVSDDAIGSEAPFCRTQTTFGKDPISRLLAK